MFFFVKAFPLMRLPSFQFPDEFLMAQLNARVGGNLIKFIHAGNTLERGCLIKYNNNKRPY